MSAYSSKSKSKKQISPLEKRIPENPKYKDVRAVVDSGASVNKYMRKIEEIRKNYRFRKDEIFKRMKVTTFVQLMIQVAQVNALEVEAARDTPPDTAGAGDGRPESVDSEIQEIGNGKENGHDDTSSEDTDSPVPSELSLAVTNTDYGATPAQLTSRSTLQSVAGGVGELDVNKPDSPKICVDETRPYLLLDLRSQEEFDECHIITALHYPHTMLTRSVNFESKEMLAYKNKQGQIVVIYDEDEKIATMAASTLVDRGYDNVFLLSGGMKVGYKLFPQGLFTGTIPDRISPMKKGAVRERASQNEFSADDLNYLYDQLDNALDDRSSGSRLSKASTTASRTHSQMSARTMDSSKSGRLSGRAPFK